MIQVVHYDRRDAADREALGKAALMMTQAIRADERYDASRFYWTGPDTIVVQPQSQLPGAFDGSPSPDMARAFFAMADLARQTSTELWFEPAVGEQQYRVAGR